MIRLDGTIIWDHGMGHSRIFQSGDEFVLLEQSEMMTEPSRETFRTLQQAVNELFSRT